MPTELKIGQPYEYKTDISTTNYGNEQRRSRWSKPIRHYSLPFKNTPIEELQKLEQFFRDMDGKFGEFLFLDDYSDTLMTIDDSNKIDTGSGVEGFYLPYPNVYPLDSIPDFIDDIKVYVNGTQRTNDITYDRTTNKVSFTANNLGWGDKIEVKYKYYVKVRFDQDKIDITETTFRLGETSVNLVEVR
jgi:uncharacterized protein (TIGR02217 family)